MLRSRTEQPARGRIARIPLFAAILLIPSLAIAERQFEVVRQLQSPSGSPQGRPFEAANGKIYGTALGGTYGAGILWSLQYSIGIGWVRQEFHAFSGPDGRIPSGGLVAGPGGYLYGVTHSGGAYDGGTVYRVFDCSGSCSVGAAPRITTLHSFSGPDGLNPHGELLSASDGYLYGAAAGGAGLGVIFRISGDGEFEVVHEFLEASAGPNGGLVESSDGYFYGTTFSGGPTGESTVFRVNAADDFQILRTLTFDEGSDVRGGLVEVADGVFMGTASYGGANSSGTLFQIMTDGGFAKIHDFGADDNDGDGPWSPPTLAGDGLFYGTTYGGGAHGPGVVYRVDGPAAVTTVHSFDTFDDGSHPVAPLGRLSTGELAGTAAEAGSEGARGTIFLVDPPGDVAVVSAFRGHYAAQPRGGLTAASDGNVYGTTSLGSGGGSVFRIDSSDTLTFLLDFGDVPGSQPQAPLLERPGNVLVGTTRTGGANQVGTIFQIGFDGQFSSLFDFASENPNPTTGLVAGSDGNLWGTTRQGGANGDGTVYEFGSSVTTAHAFDGADGSFPINLVPGDDGDLYGLTVGGGYLGIWGTAFRIDLPTGDFESIYSLGFVEDEPQVPSFLTKDAEGTLWGTSLNGGEHGDGTVFQLDPAGAVTVIHAFENSVDGYGPTSLVQASDLDYYGTAGWGLDGRVFRMTSDGTVSPVHDFVEAIDGSGPMTPLVETADGNLWGVTDQGGRAHAGVVYRLLAEPTAPELDGILPASGRSLGGTSVRLSGRHIATQPQILFGGVAAPSQGFDNLTATAIAPPLAPGALYDVQVVNPDQSSATIPQAWFVDFLDVPDNHLFHTAIETIFRLGITAGCGAGNYCPTAPVTRAQVAVFLLRGFYGAAYVPPPASGIFQDVPVDDPFAPWIEKLSDLGVTAGCGPDIYCPSHPVTRAQIAVFLLKTREGSAYTPPPATGVFDDVSVSDPFAPWIEQIANEGITGGCSVFFPLYCPAAAVTRGQVAPFLLKTFDLP